MVPILKIPLESLPAETAEAIIEAFILQEGTDYGAQEVTLPTRIAHVRRQLESGEAHVIFHAESETCTIVTERVFNETVAQAEAEARAKEVD